MKKNKILIVLTVLGVLLFATLVSAGNGNGNGGDNDNDKMRGCSMCHYQKGNFHHFEELIEEHGCLFCHVIDGEGNFLETNCKVCHDMNQVHSNVTRGRGVATGAH